MPIVEQPHGDATLKPGEVLSEFCIPFEARLKNDSRWALSEGSLFFQDGGAVQQSLKRIASRLEALGIPYAIVGGMALFQHGFRRFTEDVDLLVTSAGWDLIQRNLIGLGYVSPFTGSRNLRDTETGVRIEFLITGAFPGDGKPKPIAFPDPAHVAVELDGRKYVPLTTLIEMKLASGISNSSRLKDLADVQEVTKALSLPIAFADQLHPYVQEKFRELWVSGDERG